MSTGQPIQPWEPLGEPRPAYDGFLAVMVQRFRMPDGTEVTWDLLDGPASVAVLALTDDDRVVLVEQFRPGPGQVVQSLPGGLIDAGESPEEAGLRELREETGWSATDAELIGTVAPLNHTRPWNVVLARGAVPTGAQDLDEFEDIRVVVRPLADVRADMRTGSIGSLVQLYLALDHLGRL